MATQEMVRVPPRLLDNRGVPFDFHPDLDSPLVGPSVLALVGDTSACALWRVWQPFHRLQQRLYPAEWGFKDDPRLQDYWLRFRAIVLCRLSWWSRDRAGANRWFKLLRDAGKLIFYEADDDLFSPALIPQQAKGIARGRPVKELEQERQASVWALQQCDGVTVSTPRLSTLVGQYTDAPVAVVPNAIDADWFTAVQKHATRSVEGLTIGWAGGNRPDSDLAQMAEAWGRVARRYPHVTFVVMGHQPAVISQHVPEPRIKRVPWLPPHEYPLGLVDIDIGCCPLEDRPFNRCKTPIKAWEHALSGAAVVASPTVYGRVIADGRSGHVVGSTGSWEEALSRLVEREDERRAMAAALKRDVLAKWTLQKNVWRWPMSWRRIEEEATMGRARE